VEAQLVSRAPIKERFETWAQRFEALDMAEGEPALPEALNDRVGDIWEPLLVIAELAGEAWPERARKAAIALQGDEDDGDSFTTPREEPPQAAASHRTRWLAPTGSQETSSALSTADAPEAWFHPRWPLFAMRHTLAPCRVPRIMRRNPALTNRPMVPLAGIEG
jgi:hypothetical protein